VTFSAHFDPATARLALAGDCRMTDAPVLVQALDALRAAMPGTLRVDVGGRLDIGPSWLLHGLVADLRAAGAQVELTGRAPEHLAYLDELAAREAGTMPEPPRETLVTRLAAFGASLRLRFRSWYEELVFGGMVLASAAAAWHSPCTRPACRRSRWWR